MPRTKANLTIIKKSTVVPTDMISDPHLIFVNGILVNPGKNNDYTIQKGVEESKVVWWSPEIIDSFGHGDIHVIVIKLNDGTRWGFSNKEGIFLDTRMQK